MLLLMLMKRQRVTVYSNEQPAHSVQVSAFKMARFPVTVAEYRCFMEAGGYQNDAYWQEEILGMSCTCEDL